MKPINIFLAIIVLACAFCGNFSAKTETSSTTSKPFVIRHPFISIGSTFNKILNSLQTVQSKIKEEDIKIPHYHFEEIPTTCEEIETEIVKV